jgi:lysophospholipase L1-like esterase
LGGSITAGSTASQIGTNNWVALVSSRLVRDLTGYTFTQQVNSGIGGTPSWYGLIRLQDDVLDYAPKLVTVDFACNDISVDASGDRTSGWAPAAEALLRRLRTSLPDARIVVFIFTWPDDYSFLSELQRTVRDKWVALATQYDCTLLRWDTYLEALMGESYDDSDVEVYLAGANDLHPNDTGHDSIADMFMAEVTDLEPGWTGNLNDYDYYYANQEAADFEHEPIIRTGTDNDGTTGTWSEDGTTLVSSEANATVEWSGTFCSYGFDTTGSTGTIAYSVDGGGEKQMDTSTKSPPFGGYECFERDAHTVTVRVVSGTVKIARFLAI